MKRILAVAGLALLGWCMAPVTAMAEEDHGHGRGTGDGSGAGRKGGQGSQHGGTTQQGGHGGGHHPAHVEFFKWDSKAPPVGWLAFDFALFVALLVRFGGKPLSDHLAQQHHGVKKAIEEAAAAKADAEKKAREYEERLKRLDGEVEALKAEFRQSGEAARKRIEEQGRATADRILKDTAQQISAEEARARGAIQQEAARLALTLAEDIVRKRLDASDHKRMNDDFVRELGA